MCTEAEPVQGAYPYSQDGRYGSDIHPCVGKPGLSGPMTIVVLGLIATSNSPIGRCNLPPASHPLPPAHPLTRAIRDITVVVKKLLKILQC